MRTQISQALIGSAIDAIEATGISRPDGEVAPEYFGYVSSLGAAIIQSGVLPALIFFGEQGGGNQDRSKLLRAIMQVQQWRGESLQEYYRASQDKNATERAILESAVALKLALRTFKKAEQDTNSQEL